MIIVPNKASPVLCLFSNVDKLAVFRQRRLFCSVFVRAFGPVDHRGTLICRELSNSPIFVCQAQSQSFMLQPSKFSFNLNVVATFPDP